MPQLQVVNTTRDKPEPTGVEEFFSKLGKDYKDKQDQVEIGKLIGEYQQNRQDANAWEDLQLGLEKSNISPTKRLQTQQSLNEMKKVITERDKALNAKVKQGMLSVEDRSIQKDNLVATGYTPEEAEVYLDSPPSVKNILEKHVRDEVTRKIRKPQGQPKAASEQLAQPQSTGQPQAGNPPEELAEPDVFQETPEEITANTVAAETPIAEEWPAPEIPQNMTPAEQVKWENSNEKLNNKELKESQAKKKVLRETGFNLASMTAANESKKLPTGLGKMVVIDPATGDIRPTALLSGQINPETELYVKNLKQFLKGAKDFFGARVTNFDVSSFMAQLPSLLNSEQGRRLILKQMEYVNQLEQIHNTTLNEGLKQYGRNANYNQISKVVDNKVAVKEQDLLFKINNLVGASKYMNKMAENPEKFKDMVVMQTPEGEYMAVPKEKVEGRKAKKWRAF